MAEQDKKNIFNKLIDLLTLQCSTCLDKHQIETIMICAFKLELIEYAENNGLDELDELWESLANSLNVKTNVTQSYNNCACKCANGVCTL